MNRVFIVALAVAAVAAAACNNSAPSVPSPGPTCRPPSGSTTALVYPADNSTGIADNFGQVIVASSPSPLPTSGGHTWDVVLSSAFSGAVQGGTFTSASPPFPSPTSAPAFSNPQYQTSAIANSAGLFPGQVVSVYLNDSSSNCTPAGPIGTFTTQ